MLWEWSVTDWMGSCKKDPELRDQRGSKDLKVKSVEFTTHGRKAPLKEIREKLLKKHSKYLRASSNHDINAMSKELLQAELEKVNELNGIDSDDVVIMRYKLKKLERTRHLMVWLDNSTVANSGYLVCLITCLYDPAVFYTDEEYKEAFGKSVNIQQIIEEPQLHFIAKCGSSDSELLLYSETRLDCIKSLESNCTESTKNIEYTDKMRFCHGDMPLRAFEAGQQKGGNFFCASCGIHSEMVYHLDHVLSCPHITMQHRQDIILKGVVSKQNSLQKKSKPFDGLSKKDLEQELASRGVYDGKTKGDLKDLLSEELMGKQRVPALLINNPTASLSDIGIDNYEILPCEPLHDLGHHIENFLIEFPKHLTDAESKVIEDAVSLSLSGKDSKRCVDYRAALIKTAGIAHQSSVMSKDALLAIDTLVEMQRILYSEEKNRSPAQVLRYYNQAWYHSMLLYDYIVRSPKKLTLRKMFGVYFHNLSAHAGDMLRIISGQSANAERQERIFNSIKKITKNTTNYHPGHIIPNLFVRLQAEKEFKGNQGNDAYRQQNNISRLSKCLPDRQNTQIPIPFIKKHSREWQAHLVHISDFLLEGKGIWWSLSDDNVEFHDVSKYPEPLLRGPQLHHFRSSTLAKEEENLKSSWAKCIEDEQEIPLHIIRVKNKDGKTKKVHTGFLGDDIPLEREIDNIDVPQTTIHTNPAENSIEVEETLLANDEEVVDLSLAPTEVVELGDNDVSYTPSIINEECPPSNEMSQVCINVDNNVKEYNQSCVDTTIFDSETVHEVKSRLCKAIEVVLGGTKEVKCLDKKHIDLKNLKNTGKRNKMLEQSYQNELAYLQVQVLAKSKHFKTRLVEWEKSYVLQNNLTAPSLEQMKNDKTASSLLKKIRYSTALLNEWKINFN